VSPDALMDPAMFGGVMFAVGLLIGSTSVRR
jgi:hypothetical protein